MRLYVKQLEIDVPKWWSQPSALEDGDGTLGSSAIGGSSTTTSGALSPPQIEILKHETQSGKPSPKPRYAPKKKRHRANERTNCTKHRLQKTFSLSLSLSLCVSESLDKDS